MERLTVPNEAKYCRHKKDSSPAWEVIERLAELEDKLESGKMIELPCIREVKDEKGIKYHIYFIRDNCNDINAIDFYSTRDKTQAEARLKELQEKS